jgi:hypothetical protein
MVVQVSSKLGLIVTLGNSTIRIRFDDYLVSFLRDHDASTSVLIIGLWKFNGNGRYSARSAYNIQFHGSVQMDHCRALLFLACPFAERCWQKLVQTPRTEQQLQFNEFMLLTVAYLETVLSSDLPKARTQG